VKYKYGVEMAKIEGCDSRFVSEKYCVDTDNLCVKKLMFNSN
jgi:hypothetical protein